MDYQQNNKRKSSESSAREEFLLQPQIRIRYSCNCMLCKGKEVDGRTQKNHANNELRWKSKKEQKLQLEKIEARKYDYRSKFIDMLK